MTRTKHKKEKETNPDAATTDKAPQQTERPEVTPAKAEEGQLERIEELQQQLATLNDRYMRLRADFDNYRRRMAREREEIIQRATENLLGELLPVLDHFDLALEQANHPDDPFVAGVRMVHDQIVEVLNKAGLAPIDAEGQPFDHDCQEAIAYRPSDEIPDGHVLLQTRKGYRLGSRVLRPANVIVSSGAPPPTQTIPSPPDPASGTTQPSDDPDETAQPGGDDADTEG